MSVMQWFYSSQTLAYRLGGGAVLFLLLALFDLFKNGSSARRWREYSFILGCVAAAVAYGIINDQLTSRISWEYFYYGKDLFGVLGPQTPPDAKALSWQAVKIGAGATWTAGLVMGAALLIANNPSTRWRQLPFRTLMMLPGLVLLCCIVCGLALGALGARGNLSWVDAQFQELWQTDQFRPRRFIGVYGIHLGGYVGGVVGTIAACIVVVRKRKNLTSAAAV